MTRKYEFNFNDEAALDELAIELLDAYLLTADADEVQERIAKINLRECADCLKFNLDENACINHRSEKLCYDCCGCALLDQIKKGNTSISIKAAE